MRSTIPALSLLAALLACAGPAHSIQRTFVSTSGSDANPCTLASPCRGFQAALNVTDVGGEIIVLRSGGYGPVVINKAVSIVAPPGIYAGISVLPTQVGITVNAPLARVMLRGLTINGQGGEDGIIVNAADAMIVDRCVVSNIGNSALDAAIRMSADNVRVFVRDSVLRGGAGRGIVIDSGTSPSLVVLRSRIVDGVGNGVHANTGAIIAIADSVLSRNGGGYAHFVPSGQTTNSVILRSILTGNGAWGVYADDGLGSHVVSLVENTITDNDSQGVASGDETDGVVVMTGNRITGNGVGLFNNGGTMRSAGDNVVDTNGVADVGGVVAATVK